MRALAGVDFEVRPGEVHCIVGPNGAGKSTLIKCISGVVDPTDGEVLLDGEPLASGQPVGGDRPRRGHDLPGARPGRRPHAWPTTSSSATSSAGAGSSTGARMRRETTALLRRIGHEAIAPTTPGERPPSGRAADRVDRPVALPRRPPADHGRAVGDPRRQRDRDALRRRPPAHRRGRRRRLHLAPPRRDPPDRRPGHGAAGGRDGRVRASRPPRPPTTSSPTWSARAFEQLFPERATGGGRVLLEVRDLQRLPDVKPASFELHAGEVLGIAGLVGAGRSELLRAIYGVDRRDSGEVVDRRRGRCRRADRTRPSRPGWAWPPRTASRRRCCSSGT